MVAKFFGGIRTSLLSNEILELFSLRFVDHYPQVKINDHSFKNQKIKKRAE